MEIANILNAILVNEGIRSAMLIQPADYNEKTGKDKRSFSFVSKIKKLFPALQSSDTYDIYQGTIISKRSYDGKVISLGKMGEILGYPCYADFETLNRDEPLYNIKLVVSYDNKELQLFNNICKDKKTATAAVAALKALSTKAFEALTNVKYKGILDELKITQINRVFVDIENIIPTQHIINKLIGKKKIASEEIDVIRNVLYNMGFTERLSGYEFQYNNPIHIGVLLDVLVKEKYDLLSPFYPLQNYPKQAGEVDRITIALENAMIDILDKTKTKLSKTKTNTKTTRRIRSL
jgi:hypothetical protein